LVPPPSTCGGILIVVHTGWGKRRKGEEGQVIAPVEAKTGNMTPGHIRSLNIVGKKNDPPLSRLNRVAPFLIKKCSDVLLVPSGCKVKRNPRFFLSKSPSPYFLSRVMSSEEDRGKPWVSGHRDVETLGNRRSFGETLPAI
jgi:hypothetical protein